MSEERKTIIDKTGEELLDEVEQAIDEIFPSGRVINMMCSKDVTTIEESAGALAGFIVLVGPTNKSAMATIIHHAIEMTCRAIVMRKRDAYEE